MDGELRDYKPFGDEILIIYAIENSQDALNRLEKLKGEEVSIEVKKKSLKRSLNANSYLWKLCTEMAKALHSDKDTVYLLELSRYGVFTDLQLNREALPLLKRTYRYVQEFDEGNEDTAFVRCYIGSSTYDKEEMSVLLDGVVNDAKDLGVETWNRDEIEHLKVLWNSQ